MKKLAVMAVLLGFLLSYPPVTSAKDDQKQTIEDILFGLERDEPSEQELKALEQIKDWKEGNYKGIRPIKSNDGTVKFVYGIARPTISCAVLQVTDIQFEPGETILSINMGDTVRWTADPAITGTGSKAIEHLILKPLETNLSTSLIVTTDRRTYHMLLKSYRNTYMPSVSFVYPDNVISKFQKLRQKSNKVYEQKKIDGTSVNFSDLDFNYTIKGTGYFKPTRVYNDGTRTVIEMPKAVLNKEAPSLLVIDRNTDQETIVNYRMIEEKYIVDTLFDEAILISGVGFNQKKITIKREN